MEFGDFISTGDSLTQDLIQSGTILSWAQSPPPITFPALAEAILILLIEELEKKVEQLHEKYLQMVE